LQKLADTGDFRPDLYYRLSVLTIDLPPLRERAGDIQLLTEYFLCENAQDKQLPHLTQEVWNALLQYNFPGNVRELENALIRAVALSTGMLLRLTVCRPR
jgi:transcriptional regulator with PAS, ATPase and Fis domain